eukprot:8811791-Ditylum_brightwellii.AAC.1
MDSRSNSAITGTADSTTGTKDNAGASTGHTANAVMDTTVGTIAGHTRMSCGFAHSMQLQALWPPSWMHTPREIRDRQHRLCMPSLRME